MLERNIQSLIGSVTDDDLARVAWAFQRVDVDRLEPTGNIIQDFLILWNGAYYLSGGTVGVDTLVTLTLTGGAGTSSMLGFEANSVGGAYYLEDVDLETAGSTPEPASVGLLAAGLFCMIIRGRKKVQSIL
jgi:hypothetical protein